MKKLGAFFVIAAALLSGGCSLEANAVPKDVKSDIQKEFGIDIYVPEFGDYPVTHAAVIYPPAGMETNKKDLALSYGSELGKLEDAAANEEIKSLYGPYNGKRQFTLTYSTYKIDIDGNAEREVDGEKIQYSESDGKYVFANFNADGGSYRLEFLLDKEFSEEDALDVIEDVLKHTEEK